MKTTNSHSPLAEARIAALREWIAQRMRAAKNWDGLDLDAYEYKELRDAGFSRGEAHRALDALATAGEIEIEIVSERGSICVRMALKKVNP